MDPFAFAERILGLDQRWLDRQRRVYADDKMPLKMFGIHLIKSSEDR